MGKRSEVTDPVCRILPKDVDGLATFAIYGPNRRMTWLAVHALTPTVVRLWPQVVRFLSDALDELADPSNRSLWWQLPRHDEYPEYVVIKTPGGDPWLYVFAASPNAVRLTPDRVAFLRQALADLPAISPAHADRHGRPTVTKMRAAGA
jgi:hypothetical protein